MKLIIQTLIFLSFAFFVMEQATWSRKDEHVDVILQENACLPLVGAVFEDDKGLCFYPDLTLEGSILRREIDMIDVEGNTVSISRKQLNSGTIVYHTSTGKPSLSSFTWRTGLLFALLMIAVFWPMWITIWCRIRDLGFYGAIQVENKKTGGTEI